MTLPGIDLSSWQGPPADWQSNAGHIDWAAIKISELGSDGSRYVSPDAAADWAYLRQHGLGRVAYFYGHPSISASASVALFLGALDALGLADGDAVALDIETTDGRTAAEVYQWCLDALQLVQRETGRIPLCYTYLSFAEAGNCRSLAGFPLYVSDPSSPPGHPRVPAPWRGWSIHQTSITSALDRDVAAYATLGAMRAALGKPVPGGKVTEHTTGGALSLAGLAAQYKTAPSAILRETADHFPAGYPTPVADYINGVFRGTVKITEAMPPGLTLYLPA